MARDGAVRVCGGGVGVGLGDGAQGAFVFGVNVVFSCSSAIKLLGEPSTGTRILFIKSPLLLSNKCINITFKYAN